MLKLKLCRKDQILLDMEIGRVHSMVQEWKDYGAIESVK
jgi:hypothetical protein